MRRVHPVITSSVLGLLAVGTAAAQCRYTEQAIVVPADRSDNDRFGAVIDIHGDRALITSFLDDEGAFEGGAAYLFHWDGMDWVENQKLLAGDPEVLDIFGYSGALDGDVLVIGAIGKDDLQGAAYVFRNVGGVWAQEQKLQASDGSRGDEFGTDVDIEGDVLVVGAWGAAHQGQGGGAAYVFEFDGAQWSETQKLVGSRRGNADQFGISVAMSGDAILVGADEGSEGGAARGKAYVFRHDGNQWNEEQRFRASDNERQDWFGRDVSIDGDALVVGAPGGDDSSHESGAAYFFTYDGRRWNEVQILHAQTLGPFSRFGNFVTLEGDRLLVGAFTDLETAYLAGAAYIYDFDPGTGLWTNERKLLPTDPMKSDLFGEGLAIEGDRLLVGNESFIRQGAAYSYLLTDLSLMSSAHELDVGDDFTLTTCEGQPGTPVLIVVVDAGGPLLLPIHNGVFDADGRHQLSGTFNTPGLSGLHVFLQSFGRVPGGGVAESDRERVVLR